MVAVLVPMYVAFDGGFIVILKMNIVVFQSLSYNVSLVRESIVVKKRLWQMMDLIGPFLPYYGW